MNEIQSILADIQEIPGVKGAGVLTADGMMVASTLGQEFLDDVVAGLASFLISTTRRALREGDLGQSYDHFERFVLNSTHGKVVLMDLGESFLVVITNQFVDLRASSTRIGSCADALRRAATI